MNNVIDITTVRKKKKLETIINDFVKIRRTLELNEKNLIPFKNYVIIDRELKHNQELRKWIRTELLKLSMEMKKITNKEKENESEELSNN